MEKKREWYFSDGGGTKLKLLKMKLTVVLVFLVTMVNATGFSQATKLSMRLENASIREVIQTIEEKTPYIFLYKDEIFDFSKKYSFDFQETNFEVILKTICEQANVAYEIRDKQILLKEKEKENPGNLQQQRKTVNGLVTGSTGEPLPGVTVLVKGTATGTITDENGKFQLEIPAAAQTLVFSFIGMKTVEVQIGNQTLFNVQMVEDILGIDEVVVVGYGTQKKSDITGTVTSLSKDRLEMVPNLNITQAIQGAVPGVIIETAAAGANPDQSIMIRGRSSISADTEPLVVVDGIPYGGSLSDINPKDIASVEILKDASAAAIYGSRGANGVILITTKGGADGKTKFSYDGKFGSGKVINTYRLLTGPEFYDFKNIRNPAQFWATEVNNYKAGVSTDWVKLGIRTGQTQEHNISVSGGFKDTKFYIGGGLTEIKGVARGDDFRRFTTRLNIETKLLKWLSVGTRTQLNFDDASGRDVDWYACLIANPLAKPYDNNGNYLIYPIPENIVIINPLTDLIYDNIDKSWQILTNNYLILDFPFIKGLSYRFNTGVRTRFSDYGNYGGRNTYDGYRYLGTSSTSNSVGTNMVLENILSYNREFGDHTVFLTGLYSYEDNMSKSNALSAQQFPNDFLSWYGVAQASIVKPSTSYRESVLVSQMFRANYSYASRYLATFTIRRDGYSGFGENSKWGVFPSFALGWNINNESFFPAKDIFNVFKLRASYGLNGNQAINPYASLPKFTVANIMSGSTAQIGYKPSVMGVVDLGWESAKTLNIGIDFGLFKNRVTGNVDGYLKNNFDLLLNRSISVTHGINQVTQMSGWTHPGVIQNIGKTRNKGIEVSVNSRNIAGAKFQWTTNGNFSYNKNEIVSIYGIRNEAGKEIDDISNKWFIGHPVRVNYDFIWDGVWQLGEESAAAVFNSQPGYVKLRDVDKNGKLDDKDRQIIGQLDPKIMWGLTNTFTYGNFTFSFFFHGVNGITAHNDRMTDDVQVEVRYNTLKKNWWTPDNPTNDWVKNAQMANQMSGFGGTLFEKADFVRLKDISLAYDLPKSVINRIGFSNLRMYVTGRNLLTFTKWSGLDPELVEQAAQRNIPMQKELLVGLSFGF